MAHSLSITYGSTTIPLTLVDRTPKSAPASEPTVTGYWEVNISAATSALLVEEIHKINRAFEQARQRQDDPFLDRVYLNFLPKDLTDSQRSEILDGNIEFYDETLKYAWANKAMDLRLVIERRNYWEGELTAIPLSNSNGTDVTSGLNVYNCNDGTGSTPNIRENFADIDGADIDGDLPAPLKIYLITTDFMKQIIFTLNYSGTPSSLAHSKEIEDAVGVSVSSDADCSGGEYGEKSFTEVDTAKGVFVFYGTWSWDDLEFGRWYLPFLRLRAIPTIADLWTRVRIILGTIEETAWIKYPASSGPQVIQYPPIRFGFPGLTMTDSDISAQFKTSTAGTKTIQGDFIYFLPVDGVRIFETEFDYVEEPIVAWLTDDPYEGYAYQYVSHHAIDKELVIARGNPLMVNPERDARLYFCTPGDAADVDDVISLKAWYRPRRLSL